MNGRRHVRLLLLVTFSLLIMFSVIGVASANVPSVVQIDNISLGSSGRIRLQISHLNPSPSHYVDMVEVDVNGQVTQFNLQPQNSNPFTVELDLGQLQGTPNVKARAHCNLHGWGSWSNQIQVPEFAEVGAIIVVALIGPLLIARTVMKK